MRSRGDWLIGGRKDAALCYLLGSASGDPKIPSPPDRAPGSRVGCRRGGGLGSIKAKCTMLDQEVFPMEFS